MKKINRESLRMALYEYQHAHRVFVKAEQQAREYEEIGIDGPLSPTVPVALERWMLSMDLLEETLERVLEDER